MEKDEIIFYNIGIFQEQEDLIVFPMYKFIDSMKKFENIKKELMQCLIGYKIIKYY